MNNDKRDEAAEKYWQDHCKDKGLFEHPLVPEVFKAGWDACAAEKDEHYAQVQSNYELWLEKAFQLAKERDELKAEIEEWKIHLDLEIRDCDQWREQAEALACVSKKLVYYSEALMAREFEPSSKTVNELCEMAKVALAVFEASKKGKE